MRAYSKNGKGDQDETLIPESLKGWYSDEEFSSDDTFEEDVNIDSSEVHTDEE